MYNEETLEFYHGWDLAIAKDAGFTEGKTAGFSEGKTAGFNEGKTAGFTEGEKASKIEIAKNLLNINTPIKDIIKVTGLSKKEVDSLKD